MSAVLHNVVWNSLAGAHRHLSAGTGGARRYVGGFSTIVGFADLERPDLRGLAPHCEPGAHFYCDGWSGPATDGWQVDEEATMYKMVWTAVMPAVDAAPDAVPLGTAHAPQIMALMAAAQPGPFGPRNLELGDYFGWFDGDKLVAMAGERMQANPYREISAVCTHPDYQGRGLARRLMTKLARRQLLRGETPFLHVMRSNTGAHGLYQRMGFENFKESVVRVISRA